MKCSGCYSDPCLCLYYDTHTDCKRCDQPFAHEDKEVTCACCSKGPLCPACFELCEGCDEAPICGDCSNDHELLGGPVICPDCSPSMVLRGRASIALPEVVA